MIQSAHANGHFYSPVTDPDLASRLAELYPDEPEVPGIDFNDRMHSQLLQDVLTPMLRDYDYPEHGAGDNELSCFYTQNSQFSWLDSRALFAFLRSWQPSRIIEVGSGYSSLLMADVNRRFLQGRTKIQCIEPFPRPFLRRGDLGLELIEKCVQAVPLAFFASLEPNDLLFIDSSLVCKTGSDVNYLYLKLMPWLKPGVRIHIHDIRLPQEYLREWVIDENRSWNEQYLLQALLIGSNMFEEVCGCAYAHYKFPDLVQKAVQHRAGRGYGGGSFYIQRVWLKCAACSVMRPAGIRDPCATPAR